jgi:PKD repeat protein
MKSMWRLPAPALRFVLLILFALISANRPATAQYMFFDIDGDGVYTYTDTLPPWGGPSTIDVYVVTDKDLYGSPVTCSDGTGLTLNSYTINLYALNAAVSFTSVTNQMPGMSEVVPLVTYPYALTVGYWGPQMFPPGKYHLLRITAEFESGCPALSIVRSSCYSPPGIVTSFGSSCPGVNFDNELRLGEDWLGAPGFACTDLLGRWPSLSCPGAITGVEGQPLTIPVTLTTPDCYIFSFDVYGLPQGATFSGLSPFVAGDASGVVTWTPSAGQAGTYSIRFNASQYPNSFHMVTLRDTCTTQVTITSPNAAPIAEAGGPYSGAQYVPITFDGTRSLDSDGDPLHFSWSFGDGTVGSGSTPAHAYAVPGIFTVVLTVTDPGGLSGLDSTSVSVAGDLPVRVFTSESNRTTRLPHGKPVTCFQIERSGDESFTPQDVLPASLTLRYIDPLCEPLEAYATPVKSISITDTDRNGVLEYEACFARAAMATVASCLPAGTSTVRLELHGSLANGERFHGEVMHTIISGTGSLSAAISPNPLSPNSTLEFTTATSGFATARLFDIRGRLVATLLNERSVPAGSHRMHLVGFHRLHGRLASGVYFLKVTTEHDGSETRAITILR